jgi:signal transduction histidine kinase
MATNHEELRRAVPTLRSRFESSRALVRKAHENAARVVEAAEAMRSLLRTDATHTLATQTTDLWEAAAREILHGARERDRLLAVLSHELRQALTAAIAAERLLQMTADPATATRARGVLERQLHYLSRLVEDLLDFSRISVDAVSMSRHDVDLDDVIARAVETLDSAIAGRDQHLTVTKPTERQIVCGDETRLQQVFANLLQNASRYTPPGGQIAVTSMVEPGWTHVEIRDTGEGIPTTELGAIFEPFTRKSHEGHGFGIGLALARRLVEMHGGTIAAHSDGPGHGSTFTVRLPLSQRS